jgi:nitroreductase
VLAARPCSDAWFIEVEMDFLRVVGSRRSVRWFKPWQSVDEGQIQRILEAARLTTCPGNLQPWRAVVVVTRDLDVAVRERLLAANNRQRPQELAPVWIYWYADPDAARPSRFLDSVRQLLAIGVLPSAFGWSETVAEDAIEHGREVPTGLPPLDGAVHGLPLELSAVLAAQETNGACVVATLAAVNEGLGTCLHSIAAPDRQEEVKELLGVPAGLVPVWLQLVGHPAESPEAGGQRPRAPFHELFRFMHWARAFERAPAVVDRLTSEGLLQAPAPLPGRFEELQHLSRMFGYSAEDAAGGNDGDEVGR